MSTCKAGVHEFDGCLCDVDTPRTIIGVETYITMKRERDRLNDIVTAYGNKIREIDGERIAAVKDRDSAQSMLAEASSLLSDGFDQLYEDHESERADCHAGDSEKPGEDPDDCSYCRWLSEVRTFLQRLTPSGDAKGTV